MKKVTFILLFGLFSSAMAQPCTYKDVLSKMTLFYDKTYPSKIDIQKADFSSLILNQSTDYLGAIGVHKKRLVVLISSAKRNPQNPLMYEIAGRTRVGKNVRQFKGSITLTQLISGKPEDTTNDLYTENSGVQEEGVAVGDFILDEYEDLSATGVFKGKEYNDGYLMADPYLNNAYIGTWTSKQTHKSQQVSWGHYRVPCAGDLDMGAGEFSPAPEYYKYGWDEYIQEIKKKYPNSYKD